MAFTQGNSIKSVLSEAHQSLQASSDSAQLDAQVLLSFVLQQTITYLLTWPERELTSEQLTQFQLLFTRRLRGEPIAYLVGEKEFWSLTLAVAPSTLIPRPDTETLVELVLTNHLQHQLCCLDLGTGTGAIALALASEQPNWQIEAVDYNQHAVTLAQQNALTNNITNVKIYKSDWFSAINPTSKFDVIVSNPPYIDERDHHLQQGDVRFEPLSALVASKQGYADIEHLITTAKHFLSAGGYLYLEHGFEQASHVQQLLLNHGYQNIGTQQDLAGNDRISYGQWSN